MSLKQICIFFSESSKYGKLKTDDTTQEKSSEPSSESPLLLHRSITTPELHQRLTHSNISHHHSHHHCHHNHQQFSPYDHEDDDDDDESEVDSSTRLLSHSEENLDCCHYNDLSLLALQRHHIHSGNTKLSSLKDGGSLLHNGLLPPPSLTFTEATAPNSTCTTPGDMEDVALESWEILSSCDRRTCHNQGEFLTWNRMLSIINGSLTVRFILKLFFYVCGLEIEEIESILSMFNVLNCLVLEY